MMSENEVIGSPQGSSVLPLQNLTETKSWHCVEPAHSGSDSTDEHSSDKKRRQGETKESPGHQATRHLPQDHPK